MHVVGGGRLRVLAASRGLLGPVSQSALHVVILAPAAGHLRLVDASSHVGRLAALHARFGHRRCRQLLAEGVHSL